MNGLMCGRWHYSAFVIALPCLWWANPASGQENTRQPTLDKSAEQQDEVIDGLYQDEPPLDYYQRRWRWYTRQVRPQRFSHRDMRRSYGYETPFPPTADYSVGLCRRYVPSGYGALPYEYTGAGTAYIQGRRDERRFAAWKERNAKGKTAYKQAMQSGIESFQETEYEMALRHFIRAARLNNGDPASRLHAGYAMVAIGKYDEAVLVLRRAIQLQSQIPYLPLDIRKEYGPKIDFDAHLKRLQEAAEQSQDDAGRWMLLGFYQYFSGASTKALESLNRARELAPKDRIIDDLHTAASLTAPPPKQTEEAAVEKEPQGESESTEPREGHEV